MRKLAVIVALCAVLPLMSLPLAAQDQPQGSQPKPAPAPTLEKPPMAAPDPKSEKPAKPAAAIGGFAQKCLHFRSLDRARLFRRHRISLVNSAARRPLNGHDRNRRYVGGAPVAERPIVRRWYVTRTRSAAISDLLSRVAVGVSCDNCGRIGFSGSKQERTSTSWACPSMHAFCEGAGLPRSRTT